MFLEAFRKYADLSGRSPREEFWAFHIVNAIVIALLWQLERVIGFAADTPFFVFATLYWLGTLLPSLAVSVRRLHDTNKSGWWLLLGLLPVGGFLGGFLLWLIGLMLTVYVNDGSGFRQLVAEATRFSPIALLVWTSWIGPIVLLVWFITSSDRATNQYGPRTL
jgi:uncharacterized membrane protein YhaH (DUF805 family)